MNCEDALRVIDAYADGEIAGLRGFAFRRHFRACPTCASRLHEARALSAQIREQSPRYSAPAGLRARVLADLALAGSADRNGKIDAGGRWRWLAAGAVAGCAATLLAWTIGTAFVDSRTGNDVALAAVDAHVRATLGHQLIQVASSDQHTVKPWLSARLAYSPPVRDFHDEGFALIGGRIDTLAGGPIAVLVYRYRDHMIDVFVRPDTQHLAPPSARTVRGFNLAPATGAGMDWLAVSDVNAVVLSAFINELAAASASP